MAISLQKLFTRKKFFVQGGPGSGFKGHVGRKGIGEGGSLPREKSSKFFERVNKAAPNNKGYGSFLIDTKGNVYKTDYSHDEAAGALGYEDSDDFIERGSGIRIAYSRNTSGSQETNFQTKNIDTKTLIRLQSLWSEDKVSVIKGTVVWASGPSSDVHSAFIPTDDFLSASRVSIRDRRTVLNLDKKNQLFVQGGPGSGYRGHPGRKGIAEGGSLPRSAIASDLPTQEKILSEAERNYYWNLKGGGWVEDPSDPVTFRGLSREDLLAMDPEAIVTVKTYTARRGGVARKKIKVKNLLLSNEPVGGSLPASYDVWDTERGIGFIPFQHPSVGRMELRSMKASEYLQYTPPRPGGQDTTKYLEEQLRTGEKFAVPVLFVRWEKDHWQVGQHEGRNRTQTFLKLYGDKDIPVALVFEGELRSRDVTSEMLKAEILPQVYKNWQLFVQGGPGSGHHGHQGRLGQVGGSRKGSGISRTDEYEEAQQKAKKEYEKREARRLRRKARREQREQGRQGKQEQLLEALRGMSAAEKREQERIDEIVRRLGYPTNKVHAKLEKGEMFEVSGKTYRTGGEYSSLTGMIIMYDVANKTNDQLEGMLAHEIQHDRWAQYKRAYQQQAVEIARTASSDNPLINLEGSLLDPADKKKYWAYDIHQEYMQMGSKWDRLYKTDGISAYSKSYWEKAKASGSTWDYNRAVDETLAEIARIKVKVLPREGDKKAIRPIWESLYRKVQLGTGGIIKNALFIFGRALWNQLM